MMFAIKEFNFQSTRPVMFDDELPKGRFYLTRFAYEEEDDTLGTNFTYKFGLDENEGSVDRTRDGFFAGRVQIEPMGSFPWLGYVEYRKGEVFL